ncbi:group II intron maturase-specific domain-containing protein [Paenibacillus sp. QZ-Y1]|uniref:group II intron maturase-specific domain-containing protein n=1 Tax=Paenibacillus sp. QZ-Y1 TaxID=3414511 RepID=UPI003F790DF2
MRGFGNYFGIGNVKKKFGRLDEWTRMRVRAFMRQKKSNFMVGRKTEKKRKKRSIGNVQETMRRMQHEPLEVQAKKMNQMLQGHYAYYGMVGNMRCLSKVYATAVTYWRKVLSRRSRKSYVTWEEYQRLRSLFPLMRPKIFIPYQRLKTYAML